MAAAGDHARREIETLKRNLERSRARVSREIGEIRALIPALPGWVSVLQSHPLWIVAAAAGVGAGLFRFGFGRRWRRSRLLRRAAWTALRMALKTALTRYLTAQLKRAVRDSPWLARGTRATMTGPSRGG